MKEIGTTGVLLLAFTTTAMAGCMCDAEEVEFELGLTRAAEIARTLPMLVSEKSRIAGIPLPVPDSHGYLDLTVDIPHPNITSVHVAELRAAFTVDGKPLPVRIIEIDSDGRWLEQHDEGTWTGSLEDGETARLWWTIDRDRATKMTELVLAEGKTYALTLTFDWNADSCSFKASGTVDETYTSVVRASVNAKTFEPSGTPMIDAKDGTVGFRANYTIKSGVSVSLDSSSAIAVILGNGTFAAAVIPKVSWTVNGLPGSAVKAGDTLATFSASATNPTVYARNGNVLPVAPPGSGTITMLVQDLTYRATDGSLGTVVDGFAFASTK